MPRIKWRGSWNISKAFEAISIDGQPVFPLKGFSHILVLYCPHLIDPERRKLRKVHPMGSKDLPRQGIFATCSPARPNPVLVSAVPLVARIKNVLQVRGFEAVDGSPIIDVKPHSKSYLQMENLSMASKLNTVEGTMVCRRCLI
jgi:tRNA-Thr(GGU) m(6)t(6)A37 methyltransferase TsaA